MSQAVCFQHWQYEIVVIPTIAVFLLVAVIAAAIIVIVTPFYNEDTKALVTEKGSDWTRILIEIWLQNICPIHQHLVLLP